MKGDLLQGPSVTIESITLLQLYNGTVFQGQLFWIKFNFPKSYIIQVYFFLPVRVLLELQNPRITMFSFVLFFKWNTVILSMLIKIKNFRILRGIYVTNLNFRYKYQLFIPWTIFARLRLWNIEVDVRSLFFFIAQRDICGRYRVTLKRSRSR